MNIIAIDPGKATGIALLDYSEISAPTLIAHGTHAPDRVIDALDHLAQYLDFYGGVIVIERFVLREGMYGVDTSPIGVIDRIKEWAKNKPHTLVWQLPGEKELVTNDRLRRLGLWLKGKEQRHIMDAVRHAVLYLVKNKHKPTAAKGWPDH